MAFGQPLDFIERDPFILPVIGLGGARIGMVRHVACLFERPAIYCISGDAFKARASCAGDSCL